MVAFTRDGTNVWLGLVVQATMVDGAWLGLVDLNTFGVAS